jgi:enoyl-CoA hydratase
MRSCPLASIHGLLTAEEFGAAETPRIGLVQEIVPAGSHTGPARELPQLIARRAPLGVQGMLANARVGRAQGRDAAWVSRLSGRMTGFC